MHGILKVVNQEDYDKWLARAKRRNNNMATGEFAAHADMLMRPDELDPQICFQPRSQSYRHAVLFSRTDSRVRRDDSLLLMRIHLIWPTATLPFFGEIKPETYLSLRTMHGTIMVFFVHHRAARRLRQLLSPIQIGAPDMAFPVLNMLSFWVTALAFIVMIAAFLSLEAHRFTADGLSPA
jgi:hypothetical protein